MSDKELMLLVWVMALLCGAVMGVKIDRSRKLAIEDDKAPESSTKDFNVEIIESSEPPPKSKSTHEQRMDAMEKEFRVKYADGRHYPNLNNFRSNQK